MFGCLYVCSPVSMVKVAISMFLSLLNLPKGTGLIMTIA